MKVWQILVLIVVLTAVPVLTACDALGIGGAEQRQQEYYEEQLKAIQKQRDAYQKQMDDYYQERAKAFKLYEEVYKIWWEQQQEAKLGQYQQQVTDNQTDNQTQQQSGN